MSVNDFVVTNLRMQWYSEVRGNISKWPQNNVVGFPLVVWAENSKWYESA